MGLPDQIHALQHPGLRLIDFFGREAEEETIKLRDIEILEIDTQEEKMYAILEEMEKQRMQLLPTDGTPGDGV